MTVLKVAIKAIKQSDQCINSTAAFKNRFILRPIIRFISCSRQLMEHFSSASSESFLPKKVLVQASEMEKLFIKKE